MQNRLVDFFMDIVRIDSESGHEKEVLEFLPRIHPKFRPIWTGRGEKEQIALARYYVAIGSRKKALPLRGGRVVALYCPFADQSCFPSGHRYCVNTFKGCAHGCVYCLKNILPQKGAKKDKNQISRLVISMGYVLMA